MSEPVLVTTLKAGIQQDYAFDLGDLAAIGITRESNVVTPKSVAALNVVLDQMFRGEFRGKSCYALTAGVVDDLQALTAFGVHRHLASYAKKYHPAENCPEQPIYHDSDRELALRVRDTFLPAYREALQKFRESIAAWQAVEFRAGSEQERALAAETTLQPLVATLATATAEARRLLERAEQTGLLPDLTERLQTLIQDLQPADEIASVASLAAIAASRSARTTLAALQQNATEFIPGKIWLFDREAVDAILAQGAALRSLGTFTTPPPTLNALRWGAVVRGYDPQLLHSFLTTFTAQVHIWGPERMQAGRDEQNVPFFVWNPTMARTDSPFHRIGAETRFASAWLDIAYTVIPLDTDRAVLLVEMAFPQLNGFIENFRNGATTYRVMPMWSKLVDCLDEVIEAGAMTPDAYQRTIREHDMLAARLKPLQKENRERSTAAWLATAGGIVLGLLGVGLGLGYSAGDEPNPELALGLGLAFGGAGAITIASAVPIADALNQDLEADEQRLVILELRLMWRKLIDTGKLHLH